MHQQENYKILHYAHQNVLYGTPEILVGTAMNSSLAGNYFLKISQANFNIV